MHQGRRDAEQAGAGEGGGYGEGEGRQKAILRLFDSTLFGCVQVCATKEVVSIDCTFNQARKGMRFTYSTYATKRIRYDSLLHAG